MTTAPAAITAFIVDDHSLLRSVMAMALTSRGGISVVGQAENGREAVEQVATVRPDVVLMDIMMPLLDGMEATRRIHRECPRTAVIVLTAAVGPETVLDALRAGATGLLAKTADLVEVERAIQTVARGTIYVSPELAGPVLATIAARGATDSSEDLASLSSREREVVQLIGEGHSTQEIAGGLFISPKTVAQHKANIVKKLGLRGTRDLQLVAAKWLLKRRVTA